MKVMAALWNLLKLYKIGKIYTPDLYFRKIEKGGESSDDGDGWEKMQIKKAITGMKVRKVVFVIL